MSASNDEPRTENMRNQCSRMSMLSIQEQNGAENWEDSDEKIMEIHTKVQSASATIFTNLSLGRTSYHR